MHYSKQDTARADQEEDPAGEVGGHVNGLDRALFVWPSSKLLPNLGCMYVFYIRCRRPRLQDARPDETLLFGRLDRLLVLEEGKQK